MTVVLDYYAVQSRATLACFKANGADGIAHYLTASMSDPREINRRELEDSHDLGLAVHLFYEMNPTYAGYFTFAQGAEDCRKAQDRLADLGAPDGTVVYFAVDVNIDPALTVDYFNGVESAATPRIAPGGYGYQAFCEYAFEHFPNVGKHLAQTYGVPTVPLDLWQHLQEDRCGTEVDVNEARAPGWRKEDDMDQATFDRMAADWWTRPAAAGGAEGLQTIEAIKTAITNDEAKIKVLDSETATVPDALVARVIQRVGQILFLRAPDRPAGVPPTATWFSESDDLSTNGWTYPDGVIHFWRDGVELVR